MASNRYVTIAVTTEVRAAINSYAAWAGGLGEQKLSNSDAIAAALAIARRHPDEVLEHLKAEA